MRMGGKSNAFKVESVTVDPQGVEWYEIKSFRTSSTRRERADAWDRIMAGNGLYHTMTTPPTFLEFDESELDQVLKMIKEPELIMNQAEA